MRVRIAVPLLLLAACLWPPRAEASLAREPIVRVLRRANDDLRACRERHHLPAGRYLVRLVIDPTGKVREVELGAAPEHPGAAAESCIAAAFTHLRFETGYEPAPEPDALDRVTGGGRRSAVPPDLRNRVSGGRGGIIVISWPWIFD
ncbi:MAG: hypothetical protein KC619_07260 [Myxococcales bacterium]|nr:hypothetical protein [Myxococcales bacterium]